ncbi:MAG: histidine phosphatase family protein [Coxiellaceae bacterium]|nr:histidine phosphatase family protein [Coxiellaceae bacterium]
MTRLTLIRHLPTSWNREGRLQGKNDIPILAPDSELKQKIQKTQQHIPADALLNIYTSPLIRTQETAHAFNCTKFTVSANLRELDFGSYEGVKKSYMLSSLNPAWECDPLTLCLGEPITALVRRIIAFIHQVSGLESVLVFGHGSWIRAFRSLATRGNLTAMNTLPLDNCELLTFTVNIKEFTEQANGLIHQATQTN